MLIIGFGLVYFFICLRAEKPIVKNKKRIIRRKLLRVVVKGITGDFHLIKQELIIKQGNRRDMRKIHVTQQFSRLAAVTVSFSEKQQTRF